jgi:3-methyladenine DNA glycosylase AlkC
MDQRFDARRGARRKSDVPPAVLEALAEGAIQTVNLMEWLAADIGALARHVALEVRGTPLRNALLEVADEIAHLPITARLRRIGRSIAAVLPDSENRDFQFLAGHPSDLVRQWACYTVNSTRLPRSLAQRLSLTLPFAADQNMSVREVAWMAFRPHIIASVEAAIVLLEPLTRDPSSSVRRFAIEATRPRSVWGTHCEQLKRRPHEALSLLENVRQDPVRYVQFAVGNWLNDASKSQPDWVAQVCEAWSAIGNTHTNAIIRRALRTIARRTPNAEDGLSERGSTLARVA